jgi:hypothetical protein
MVSEVEVLYHVDDVVLVVAVLQQTTAHKQSSHDHGS